jgi:hypothetical protein
LFALLFVVDWFLYFRHAGHFFQADSIFLLNHRAHSVWEYLREFTVLNPSGWYRPLANELIESILFPIAGLHPIAYRIPVYAAFLAVTAAVYALAMAVTGRRPAAAIAAFFFTMHTTNAYTTYDVGFLPELQFTLAYLVAALAYLRYLRNGSRAAYWLSVACFVASLFSKEAAVTLPAALFLAAMMFDSTHDWRKRTLRAIRSTLPHFVILAAYLLFAIGYLHIQGVTIGSLLDRSQKPNPGDYVPVLNNGMLKNADLAVTWAFNIPRGSWHASQDMKPGMIGYLKLFRILVFALVAGALIGPGRKAIVFGSAWFWITLLPALPLVAHFIPYYVFLPATGLALVVAAAFVWLYDKLVSIQPVAAAAAIVVVFTGVLYVNSRTIAADIRDNPLLGGSSHIAWNTLNDLQRLYPAINPGTPIYFADKNDSIAWAHDNGGLIKMAYGVDMPVLYESNGDPIDPDASSALVFEVRNGRLIDRRADYRSNPGQFMQFIESDSTLDLSTAEVIAGQDQYTMTFRPLRSVPVRIAYTVDDGQAQTFTASLNDAGQVTFDVAAGTPKGLYRFWAFSVADSSKWIRTERTLTVR